MKPRSFGLNKRNTTYLLFLFAVVLTSSACAARPNKPVKEAATPNPTKIPVATRTSHLCKPTLDDGVSPSYKPNAPERTVVGHGHVISGVVLSSADCQPIAHAKLEFWPEIGDLGHPDSSRATFYTDSNGQYRFECNMPDHIHMRISAPGYHTIGVNSYHPAGKPEGRFDIVLEPEK